MLITDELGHWETKLDFDPDEWFGFIYRVTNVKNGMEYLGKKQLHRHTRKKVKGRKNKKKVIKEGDWKTYTTSSNTINEMIEEFGMDLFKFEIIELCMTKGELTFREAELQWEEKVLTATMDDGSRKYYNGMIGAIKFRPAKNPQKIKIIKKCLIEGIEYETVKQAAEALDLTVRQINGRINNVAKKFKNYKMMK